ncbi:MAG: YraN family protein [Coriobacteriales bacterium]|jgi:putative endonuclease|nr:YraN family protein [Coriobacteriales bacterium]
MSGTISAGAGKTGAGKTGSKKALGARGEDIAVKYLKREGFKIMDRNWRCTPGEADVVAREDDDIVFIEVKTRTSGDNGLPEEAVNRQKRKKYENIAIHYLASHDLASARVRFDVISIILVGNTKAFLRHHRDAFGVGD